MITGVVIPFIVIAIVSLCVAGVLRVIQSMLILIRSTGPRGIKINMLWITFSHPATQSVTIAITINGITL